MNTWFNIHEATVDIILIVDKADRTEVRFIRDVPTPTLQALGPSLSSQVVAVVMAGVAWADILAGCAIVLRCGAMATNEVMDRVNTLFKPGAMSEDDAKSRVKAIAELEAVYGLIDIKTA